MLRLDVDKGQLLENQSFILTRLLQYKYITINQHILHEINGNLSGVLLKKESGSDIVLLTSFDQMNANTSNFRFHQFTSVCHIKCNVFAKNMASLI